jgi:hypothetical protein
LQLFLLVIGVSLIGAAGIVASPRLAIALAIGGIWSAWPPCWPPTPAPTTACCPHAADLTTATGLGLLTIFACEAAVIGFTVYGPAFIQVRHHASPLTAGYVTGAIAAGWTLCAMLVGHTPAEKDGRLVRLGAGVILVGAILASAWATAHGTMIETAAAFAVLGCGFGLCPRLHRPPHDRRRPADEQAWPPRPCPPPS